MARRGEWERLTKQLMGAQAEVYLLIPRGGFAADGRGVYYDIGTADTLSIAAHEGWHQYTQRTFRQPLPTWLEEGIATFMEGYRWEGMSPRFLGWSNMERFDQLRAAAAAGKLLPLEQILSTSPQELLDGPKKTPAQGMSGASLELEASDGSNRLLTYYAQIWALTHFLREGEGGKYRESLTRLVADAAGGTLRARFVEVLGEDAAKSTMMLRRGPAGIVVYFNKDVDAFAAEYSRFVEQIVRTGSRDAAVQGLSPIK